MNSTDLTRQIYRFLIDKIALELENSDVQIKDKNQKEIQFTKKENLAIRRKHGGTKSHAKSERPFIPKKWMQLCNRSDKAKGKLSMLTHKNKIYIEKFFRETAKRYWIEIGDYSNVGNHYHLKIKARRKVDLQNFLRVIHTHIARYVTGAKKGKPFGKFWNGLAFSEILTSGLQELRVKGYFEANRIEARYGKQKRKEYLTKFDKWVNQLIAGKSASPPKALNDSFESKPNILNSLPSGRQINLELNLGLDLEVKSEFNCTSDYSLKEAS